MTTSRNLSNVNVGTGTNTGDGDLLRTAFEKINTSISSLYNNGQFVTYGTDGRLLPGYTWEDDRDTGMYHKNPGVIGFTLNGVDSLELNNDGTISWLAAPLATQSYVQAQLNTFTGGVSAANIVVSTGNSNVSVTVNGIPVVAALPTTGNYAGRIAFYLGDIWTYSNYPVGNGAGLGADSAIARAAGSDFRWVRFRGDLAFSIGLLKPSTAPEGTLFYETGNAAIYAFLSGSWKTLSSLITSSSPSGLDVLVSLPSVGDPSNYSGRTVVVGSAAYIFISGAWKSLSDYISSSGTGGGISSSGTLPATANIGELYRKTGAGADLYVYNGNTWNTLYQYTANTRTASIKTLASLPGDVTFYNAGDLIIVGGKTYILNTTKTSWDLFTPGAANTITNIVLSAGQVSNIELAIDAVTNTKILANTITGSKLVSNTVSTRELADGAVTAAKILANSITSAKIQAGVITDREIAGNSISGSKIILGSITSAQLASNSISVSKITANNLSELSTNAGNITAGVLQSLDGKMIIDLNNKYIRIEL
jgi:hypothetical protein